MFEGESYIDDDINNMDDYIDDDIHSMKTYTISNLTLYITIFLLLNLSLCLIYYIYNKHKNKIINSNIGDIGDIGEIKNRGTINTYKSIQSIKPEICTICYEDYSEKDEIFILHCNHSYHHKCIIPFFILKGLDIKCPYCQQVITIEMLNV